MTALLPDSDMMKYNDGRGLRRKEAVGMNELVEDFIKEMKLTAGLNRQRLIAAWNVVSGAGKYTVDIYLKDKIMYCTIGSSVARNQLYFQKDVLLEQLNSYLQNDELFVKDDGFPYVKDLVLR